MNNEVFKIMGSVLLEDDDFKRGLKNVLGEAEKGSGKLSSFFSKLGKGAATIGKAVATGMGVAATGVTALVTKSVQSYADYEQLVGGVDTLFKESSAKVQEYAKNAYKTAGLSANEYMETVTSFSASLLQSLNGDTEEAAKKADMAITDMSDNANKMGTSMEMIQNAYQGFAKQNYTMLDNLKLGYGGTKEEMERLLADAQKISGIKYDISSYADVVDAIHVIQNEMGITGTTATEASKTISGSINAMKGSWQNLLTAVADDKAPFEDYMNSFIESVTNVGKNILPRVEIALNGVVKLVEQLAPKIIEVIPSLVSTLLPSIVSAATSLVEAFANTLPELANAIMNCLPDIINAFISIFNAIIVALPSLIESLVAALPTLLPILIEGLITLIVAICEMLPEIIQPIIDYLPEIIVAVVNALIENLPVLIEGVVMLVIGLVKALPQVLSALWEAIVKLASQFTTSLFNKIKQWILKLFPKSGEAILKVLSTIKDAVTTLVKNIKQIFSVVVDFIATPFKLAWNTIKTIWGVVADFFKMVWNNIKAVFSVVDNVLAGDFKSAWEGIKRIWGNVKQFFSDVVNRIKSAFSNVFNIIISPFKKAKEAIGNIVDNIKGFFSRMKLKFPNIKLPHFKIKPKGWKIGDLLKGSIPSLGIDWYAKGGIFDEPTIFPTTSGLKGVGEAGPEAVAPISELMKYTRLAVDGSNAELSSKLDTLINILLSYFPMLLERDLVLDGNALVGKLAPRIDRTLGDLTNKKERGR